jgi:diguanylate cyclase (GGDEF)-like protein
LDDLRGSLLTAVGFLLVASIALLDLRTESRLSFGLFYLIPVAACAWWAGFSPGVLVALAGAVAWQAVDYLENPQAALAMAGWNGVVRFGTLVLVASLVSRLRVAIVRERRLARTDPLTGAANGRTFYETAAVEAERARRSGRPLTLAYLDLDNFKQLNDRLGHATGDAALQAVVELIQRNVRPSDLLARLGGDEFALLLPETGAEGAVASLNRVHGQVAREMAQKGWAVAMSIGAATFPQPPKDVDHMIQRVDALMYAAKRKGKGRIEHAVVEAPDEDGAGRSCWERRATARVLCNRPARIRREGPEGGQEEFATVRDIAAGGAGLHLGEPLAEGTLLIVEPLTPGPRTLLARVTHATQDEAGWRHECELSPNLSTEELRCWLGEYADVLCP